MNDQRRPVDAMIPMRYVAKVWCGVMPRRGSGQNAGWHMRVCADCRRVRAAFYAAVRRQGGSADTRAALAALEPAAPGEGTPAE